MEPKKGFYSVVQYCPDHSRMEAANVGVVLFVPETRFIKARMARANARICRFFGADTCSTEWLKAAKASLVSRLEVDRDSLATVEDLARFSATRANELLLTPPRPIKVRGPEEELDRLFHELVGRRPLASPREAVAPELDTAFRRPSFANRILFAERVTVPVVNRPLDIPYAYQNGAVHLVKTIAVSGRCVDQKVIALAAEGDLLQRKSQRPTRLIVVPEVHDGSGAPAEDVRQVVDDLFHVYDIRRVWQEQLQGFIEEVDREAHAVPPEREAPGPLDRD